MSTNFGSILRIRLRRIVSLKREVALDVGEVLALGAEVRQVVQALLGVLDRVGQLLVARHPGAARQNLGVVALQQRCAAAWRWPSGSPATLLVSSKNMHS